MHVLFLEPATINKQERAGTYKKVVAPASATGNRLPITFSSFLYHQSFKGFFHSRSDKPASSVLCARRITPEPTRIHPHGKTRTKTPSLTPQSRALFPKSPGRLEPRSLLFSFNSRSFSNHHHKHRVSFTQLDKAQSLIHTTTILYSPTSESSFTKLFHNNSA